MGAFDQLWPLLGVVVGATGSYVVASSTERFRQDREQSARLADYRLKAYTNFGQTMKDYAWLLASTAAKIQAGVQDIQDDAQDWEIEIERCEQARSRAFDELLILADPETIASARELQSKIWAIESHIRNGSTDGWQDLLRRSSYARTVYYRNVRRELGLEAILETPTEALATPFIINRAESIAAKQRAKRDTIC